MEKITSEDPIAQSADIVSNNIDKLTELFPDAIVEGKVDFDVLRQLLGDSVDDREERYGLNWHGKRAARQLALTPSMGTLRPCPEESVNWDTTQNLMIEGDNLEVLKLLQKSYSGKVKLIYIDPPYNTGNDFVYTDDFRDGIQNYLQFTGQRDSGVRVSSNNETDGRFHTKWLAMMFPRVKVARNLLSQDGVIFISADDHEQAHARKLCEEVFGEENFVAQFIWQKRTTRENRKVFSVNHDYVLCFARDKTCFEEVRNLLPLTQKAKDRYTNVDNDPRGPWQSVSINAQAGPGRRQEQFYSITTPGGRVVNPPAGRCWIYTEDRFAEVVADNRIWFGEDGMNVPRLKQFLSESDAGLTPHTLWTADEVGTTDSAKRELTAMFNGVTVFDTPKPVGLLNRIAEISLKPGELAIDFFGGSAPLGEALIRKSHEKEETYRFILVQIPEEIDPSLPQLSQINELGIHTIADISKDRLRRVTNEYSGTPTSHGNGFRVFKLDSSNIETWDPNREDLEGSIDAFVDHIKDGRSDDDVLYELLLKLGLDLCVPMEQKEIAGKTVHSIGAGVLFACLDTSITADDTEDLAHGIAQWHQELAPAGESTVVFRDSAFGTGDTDRDVIKTNLTAILQQHGLDNVRSL